MPTAPPDSICRKQPYVGKPRQAPGNPRAADGPATPWSPEGQVRRSLPGTGARGAILGMVRFPPRLAHSGGKKLGAKPSCSLTCPDDRDYHAEVRTNHVHGGKCRKVGSSPDRQGSWMGQSDCGQTARHAGGRFRRLDEIIKTVEKRGRTMPVKEAPNGTVDPRRLAQTPQAVILVTATGEDDTHVSRGHSPSAVDYIPNLTAR